MSNILMDHDKMLSFFCDIVFFILYIIMYFKQFELVIRKCHTTLPYLCINVYFESYLYKCNFLFMLHC